jgi:hypothetical protein
MIQTMSTNRSQVNRSSVEVREPDPSGGAPIPAGDTFTYSLQFPAARFCSYYLHIREDLGLGG